MREYDDHIRLYTPVMQRVIILVAVIVAVPVVLWTITAFVRGYVAPPRAPTFQHVAMAPNADNAAVASDANQAPAPSAAVAEAGATAPGVRSPLLEIKKPPASDQPQSSGASASPAAPQAAVATAIQPAGAPPSAAQPISPPPTAAPPAPIMPSKTMPSVAEKTDRAAAATAADRGIVWPDPSANLPAPNGAANAMASATPQASAAGDADGDALPAVAPLTGRIPLPRRRPALYAMVQTAMAVPLPRARPAAAPAPTPATMNDASPAGFDPGMSSGRY